MANPNIEAAYFWVQIGQTSTNQKFRVKGSDFMDVAKGPEMVLVQRGNDHYWTWYGQPKDVNNSDFSYRFNYYVTPPVNPGSSGDDGKRTQPDGDGLINISLFFEAPGPYPANEWKNVRNTQQTINDLDGKEFKTLNNTNLKDGDVCRITHEGGDFEAWYVVDGKPEKNSTNVWLKFQPLYTKSETENRERTDVKRTGQKPDADGTQVLKFDFYSKEKAQPFTQIADTDWVWAQKAGVKYKVSGKNFKELFRTDLPNFEVVSGNAIFNMKMHDTSQVYQIERVENGRVYNVSGSYTATTLPPGNYFIPMEGCEWFKLMDSQAIFDFKPNFDTSSVTCMANTLAGCRNFNGSIAHFDMSNCTSTNRMLYRCYNFNTSIAEWDLSTVTNAREMFYYCNTFNASVTNLKLGAGTAMSMFENCHLFNQPLTGVDLSNVTNAYKTFSGFRSFNQPIDHLNFTNVSNGQIIYTFSNNHVLNQDFSGVSWPANAVFDRTFENCRSLNHPNLYTSFPWPADTDTLYFAWTNNPNNADVSGWTQPLPRRTTGLFSGWNQFNQNVSHLDLSNTTEFAYTFASASKFNSADTGNLNVHGVTNMNYMFYKASGFRRSLNNWDVSCCTKFAYMFANTNFVEGIGNWNVTNATNMRGMFSNSIISDDLSGWNVSNVKDFAYAFKEWGVRQNDLNAIAPTKQVFHVNFENWDMRSVENISNMFNAAGVVDPSEEYLGFPKQGVTSFNTWAWRMPKLTDPNYQRHENPKWKYWNHVSLRYSSPIVGVPGLGMPVIEPGYEPAYTIWGEVKMDLYNSKITASRISNYLLSDGQGMKSGSNNAINIYNMQIDIFENSPGSIQFNPSNYRSRSENYNWEFAQPSGPHPELMNAPTCMFNLFAGNSSSTNQYHINVTGFGRINTKNVSNMDQVFYENTQFVNQVLDIEDWDTSNVLSMDDMFSVSSSSPNYTIGDLRGWCVQHITEKPYGWVSNEQGPYESMPCWGECPPPGELATCGGVSTNMPDGPWRDERQQYWISSVNNNTEGINFGTSCNIYRARVGTSNWDYYQRGEFVYLSTTHDYIIATNNSYIKFQGDYTEWEFKGADTSNVQDMTNMFRGARYFRGGDMSDWDVSNVDKFSNMFYNCQRFYSDLGTWDTSSAWNMAGMFRNCKVYNSDLSGWDVSNVTNSRDFSRDANSSWNAARRPQFN
jgi:surface protein